MRGPSPCSRTGPRFLRAPKHPCPLGRGHPCRRAQEVQSTSAASMLPNRCTLVPPYLTPAQSTTPPMLLCTEPLWAGSPTRDLPPPERKLKGGYLESSHPPKHIHKDTRSHPVPNILPRIQVFCIVPTFRLVLRQGRTLVPTSRRSTTEYIPDHLEGAVTARKQDDQQRNQAS